MNSEDASALLDLQMHWDEAYVIGVHADTWSARFRGSTDDLLADNATELRELIRADYTRRQQARLAKNNGIVDFANLRGERMST